MTETVTANGMDNGIANGLSHGLMAAWADIDPDYVLRYQRWLNCEHMIERVSIPGFLRGRRYRSINDTPHFFVTYETQSTAVLSSDEYMKRLNSPTPWTQEALSHFRNNTVRNIYSEIATTGNPGEFAAPYIVPVRFDLPDSKAEAVYAARWMKAACEDDGVERIRLYRQDSAIGNITTSERKIYNAGPGEQAYLLLIEYLKPPPECVGDLFKRWDAAFAGEAHIERTNEEYGTYWLEMAHKSGEAA